jgi:cell division septal protein FtsQ
MKDQVVAARGGKRSAPAKGRSATFTQRPARRDSGVKGGASSGHLRRLFAYLPMAARVILVIVAAILVFVGYRTASSASLFQVRRIDVSGTSRTSPEEIAGFVRRAAGKSGVWRADLPAISAELERLPGIKTAVVSRVLPDGLRVRIKERVPAGVVRTVSGKFVWTDEDAVVLREMTPADQIPTFFIRGWNEEETEPARLENVERMQKYLELMREWSAAGLADRISEVNLMDIRDIRAQLTGADSQIEVRLGGQDSVTRLKNALHTLDGYRPLPQGSLITYVDITQGTRAILGYATGAQISAAGDGSSDQLAQVTDPAIPNKRATMAAARTGRVNSKDVNVPANAPPTVKPRVKQPDSERSGNKNKSRDEAKALTRSRRTG